MKRSKADRFGGVVAFGIGSLMLVEAIRLYPQRQDAWVGDHMTFALLGSIMIIGGFLLMFVLRLPAYKAEFPTGGSRGVMLAVIGCLILYRILLPLIGYLVSTLLISIGLFKVMGAYSWLKSILYGVLLTAGLYGVFILWLQMSFPNGVF